MTGIVLLYPAGSSGSGVSEQPVLETDSELEELLETILDDEVAEVEVVELGVDELEADPWLLTVELAEGSVVDGMLAEVDVGRDDDV